MKILIFLHGTILMHKAAIGRSRARRVKQVIDGERTIYKLESYVPIGNAIRKIQSWRARGAEIYYLSPHKHLREVVIDKSVLVKYDFPNGPILYRKRNEQYKDVVKRILPDIIIEDDCESIGGKNEMTYPQLDPKLRAKVKSIVVKEFGGINNLPINISTLLKY